MNLPLVTVIIPCFNNSKSISFCLKSILNQTYSNIEIIVVNDGSTDESVFIINKFLKDFKNIRLIDQINHGLGYSRNQGLINANGQYICTVDGDDYISRDYIEKLLIPFLVDSKLDITVCNTYHVKKGIKKQVLSSKKSISFDLNTVNLNTQLFSLSLQLNLSESWGKMYKNSFLKSTRLKYYDTSKILGVDFLFNHSLVLLRPRINIINESLYFYNVIENSSVRKQRTEVLEQFLLIYLELNRFSNRINLNVQDQTFFIFSSLVRQFLNTKNFIGDKKPSSVIRFFFKNSTIHIPKFSLIFLARIPLGLKVFSLLIKSRNPYLLSLFQLISKFRFLWQKK